MSSSDYEPASDDKPWDVGSQIPIEFGTLEDSEEKPFCPNSHRSPVRTPRPSAIQAKLATQRYVYQISICT